jgi:hypothetical protein
MKDTGLSCDEALAAIDELGKSVRVSNVPDAKGNPLYTLRNKSKKIREIVAETRAFLAGTVR